MKLRILSVITSIVLVFGITNLTKAATVNSNYVTTLTNISAINKIEVRGNVELYISDATSDQVKVYNKYYSESAVVQTKNGVLNIASYGAEKLVVWVSANDLRSVSAYDNSDIKSFGQFSNIEFNVDLHDNASAKLNIDAFSANVSVSDHATANVSGKANKFTLNHTFATSVNNNNLQADHFTENKINFPVGVEDEAGI
jgi:hypothetical protein